MSPALSLLLSRKEARALHDHATTPADVAREPAAATLRRALARLLADWHVQRREGRGLRVSAAQARVILGAALQLREDARRERVSGEACAAILTASRKAEDALTEAERGADCYGTYPRPAGPWRADAATQEGNRGAGTRLHTPR